MNATKLENRWRDLGRALKALRERLDLGQKEVIDRCGEEIGERTLRGYEYGEQRPSRDRLLRLLIRAFGIKDPSGIDGYMKLARYAPLTEAEVLQFDLGASVNGAAVLPTSGAPADFRIEVSTLIAVDGQGQEVWRHQFPTRFAQGAYQQQDAIKRCTFVDVDGDGPVETLFVHWPINFDSVGATLICFGEDGAIKWQFVPGNAFLDDTRRKYYPPYFISNVQVIPFPQSDPRILVSSNHYAHNPNQIAMLDAHGQLISEYWHSGHLLSITHVDLNGDGFEEILLGGANHGYRQATLLVFDSRNVSGASRQPALQILEFAPGTEKAIVFFPRTCLAGTALQNRVAELRLVGENRILVAVSESTSDPRYQGLMLYELDYGLKVISAQPDVRLRENHRTLELQGILDHVWTDQEAERLGKQVTVRWMS